jgi:hypothetical protein
MKRYFFDLWDRLEQTLVRDAESPEQRRSRATLIVISSLTVIAGILGGTNTYLFAGATPGVLVQFMYSLIVGLAILVYFTTRRFPILLYTFLFMILLTPLLLHLIIGGFASPITIVSWSILAPMGALLVLSINRAANWFFAHLAVVFIALCLDAYVKQFAVPVPHTNIRTFAQEDSVHVQIEDTGIGISPEQIQGIFEPRFTTSGARVRAGMGLFTSHNIVQKHKGRITVKSTPGQGSIFTIVLPIDSSE